MTSKVIETKKVKVQASPIKCPGITPLANYSAICEVTEYTYINRASAANGQSWETESKSLGNIYIVTDNNGKTGRFGPEFFRQIQS